MRTFSAMLAVLALGGFAALPSQAAPLGPAGALKTETSAPADVQTVDHRWNHHCTWRRGGRVCWWNRPYRRWYGPSIYFRFGPQWRGPRYDRHRSYRDHRRR